jgi:hypothetical protein
MNAIRYITASSPDLPATFSVANAKLPQSYESAKTALATCASLDECMTWADKAEALAAYARMADDDALRKTCDRIQARAIRRMGELLKQIEPAKPGPKPELSVGTHTELGRQAAGEQAGMSKHQQVQAIRVANVPTAEFEQQVESSAPPTVTNLAKQGTRTSKPVVAEPQEAPKTRPEGFAAATHLIGTVEEFATFCRSQNPEIIAAAVMPHELKDVREHVATIDGWLDRFVVNLKD